MQCEELRERFPAQFREPTEEVTQHLESCSECRQEWETFRQLRSLAAPRLDPVFDRQVLKRLESRGLFAPTPPNWSERIFLWLARIIPPVAVAACLLLLFWMGDLALTRPGADVRSLSPEKARLWTSLPDAVPLPVENGVAPDRQQLRVGQEEVSDENDS